MKTTHYINEPVVVYLEHFLHTFTPKDFTKSPRSKRRLLTPCQGCRLGDPYYTSDVDIRPLCVIRRRNNQLSKILVNRYSSRSGSQIFIDRHKTCDLQSHCLQRFFN